MTRSPHRPGANHSRGNPESMYLETLPNPMNFADFQHLARLYVVGALEEDETAEFEQGRSFFGSQAEAWVQECRNLQSIFALSLRPRPPEPDSKARLLSLISKSQRRR